MLSPIVNRYAAKFLFLFWLIATSPPILVLIWLLRTYDNLRPVLEWVAFPMVLGWLVGSWWLAISTAYYMFEENRPFSEAVKHTWYNIRVKLAFLPIIGRLFKLDPAKHQKDDEDT